MPAVLSSVDRRSKLGLLVLDVLVSEEIDLPSEVTKYPVETGSIISDHITQGAETIRLSGTIALMDPAAEESRSRVQEASGIALEADGGDAGMKMVDIIETLRRMHKERALVSVSTGRMLYEEMAFSSLNATRSNNDGGNWISIKAELSRVRKVTLRTAAVPPERAQGPAKGRAGPTNQPAGRAGPSSTTPEPRNNSVAKGLRDLGVEAVRERFQSTMDSLRGIGRAAGVTP